MASEKTTNKNYDKLPQGYWSRSQLGKEMRQNLDAIDADTSVPADTNVLPEGQQTGLAVDAAGTAYTGLVSRTLPVELATSGNTVRFIAHYTESAAADEVVEVRLIDESDATVIDAIEFTGTGQQAVELTDTELPDVDQAVHVELEVTTASATAGETGNLNAALIESV